MKLKELFKTLATRAGVAEADAKLTAAIDAIPDFDVDDDSVANPITQNLITEKEAENKPKIKGKFTAEALNGVDALIDGELGEFFTPEQIEEFKKDQKPTMKKIGQLLAKAKELKAAGGSSAETAETIRKLNEQVSSLNTTKDTEINDLKSTHKRERYFDRLATKVLSRADVTDQAKAKDGRRVMADFEDTLTAIGGVLDIETGKVMSKSDPKLELFVNNKSVTVDSIMDQTLKDNDWLKKSDGPAPQTQIQVPGGGGDAQVSDAQRKNAERLKNDG